MDLIEGVQLFPLTIIPDERGNLMEVLRSDMEGFVKFGQAYVTTAYPGVTKAWHYHKVQTDRFCALTGMMKVALYDPRPASRTYGKVCEVFMGDRRFALLSIPPMIYHGFKCISAGESMVLNIPSECYNPEDPDEFRLPPHTNNIPYDWGREDG